MTALLPQIATPAPTAAAAEAPAPGRFRQMIERLKPLIYWRWLQTALLIGLAITLFVDRYTLCKKYLFEYTDEDQVIMWLAGHDLLQGRMHEPCFYGQDYNSCVEGYLSVPLLAWGVPYHVAVPATTVFLGLLPFLAFAAIGWWRRQMLAGGACLLIPLILPLRYSIMAGIPRGFVPGLAFAALPAILLLPLGFRPMRTTSFGELPRLSKVKRPGWFRRSLPSLRYFTAALVAMFAIQINPNCLVLLVPVAVLAILTTWRDWKFWAFGIAGLLPGAAYHLYVYRFYHVYHDDYIWYLRGKVYNWSFSNYEGFFNNFVAPTNRSSYVLSDLVPYTIDGSHSFQFVAAAFATVAILLVLRLRVSAAIAALAGVVFVMISFGYSRVNDVRGPNSVFFPLTRMYLGIPVLFGWLLLQINAVRSPKFANTPLTRWGTRAALAGLLLAGIHAMRAKDRIFDNTIQFELANAQICAPERVDSLYAVAREVQKAADAEDASLLAVGQNGGGPRGFASLKILAYGLPCVTSCDTIFVSPQERRAWRLVEEMEPKKYDKILLMGVAGGTRAAGGMSVTIDGEGEEVGSTVSVLPPVVARGGSRGGGGGGGGGRGRGGGMGPRIRSSDFGDVPYTVDIPLITWAPTNGRSAYDTLRLMGANVPALIKPRPTPENPNPGYIVQRQQWGR